MRLLILENEKGFGILGEYSPTFNYTPAKRMFLGLFWNQPVCPFMFQCVRLCKKIIVSVKSAGGGYQVTFSDSSSFFKNPKKVVPKKQKAKLACPAVNMDVWTTYELEYFAKVNINYNTRLLSFTHIYFFLSFISFSN